MRRTLARPIFFVLPVLLLVLTLLALFFQPVFAADEQFRGELNTWGATPWSMTASLGSTFVYVTNQVTETSAPTSEFKFYNDTGWYSNDTSLTFGQIFGGMNTATGPNMRFNHAQNSYYAFKWNGSDRGVIFQLSGAPASITNVSQSPTVPTDDQAVIVTATTSTTPPAEQALWLRYAINGNWAGSPVVKMSGSGTTYAATIPLQNVGTQVSYYVFSSGDVASIGSGDADLMTINAETNSGSNYNYTVLSGAPATITDARAFWLDTTTFGWNGVSVTSYRLLYDPDGGLVPAVAQATTCALPLADPCHINLTHSGNVFGFAKNPNATGLIRLTNSITPALAKELLRGQVAVASYNGGGTLVDITGIQHQSVLDYLYVDNGTADLATLGVTYSGNIPTLRVWAPTAQTVTLRRYANSTTTISTTHTMTLDNNSGVWSITGDSSWDRQFYLLDVEVYVPSEDELVNNLVTDPYAVSLSTDSLRSQFVNLDDADIQPTGWNSLTKPTLNSFTDITIYEMHIRDFSINDPTVAQADRGTYMAFTYDGQDLRPGPSAGMTHLLDLQDAGLTHVHLLPAFDIATVPEANVPRNVWPNPTGHGRADQDQQATIAISRTIDGFNWGYDPFHYGVPEGSYATDPDGAQRILEFRQMVQVLNQNGLRVVMDVVYNHTAASGQGDKSVLDKVVPGYYHRYDNNGTLQMSSCCDDTATEYAMMEKLMIDTLVRFAEDYKVDGFRFDLMNLHTRQNMINVQTAITAVDPDIYLYGEGWTFGSAQTKGLTNCPNCFADKYNMGGVGIGLFNDIIRDAVHGGYEQDALQIRRQGFINGLSYDWNGYFYGNRDQSDLHTAMNILRSGLRASGADWNGAGGPFAQSPQESMPYVSKHDNETLFDQNVFKMPLGVTMEERVRAQNMGLSLMALSQGVPFFHMASDIMRSKSLDRNSYDSGDWFNRVYWDRSHNNFGQGLPPAWDNSGRWGIMTPLLENTALDPTTAHMNATAVHFQDMLRIRQSSSLFRLQTMAEVNNQVVFFNGDNSENALIVMGLLNDSTPGATYETILVFFNADKNGRTFQVAGANGFTLHPNHSDPVVTGGASFNEGTDTFTIPARTTAVFVSPNAITPPVVSNIDWVGNMFPVGGESAAYNQGSGTHTVYVRVYKEGVTPGAGQGAGIACFLHWGQYGTTWTDTAMSYNVDIGNDDEYGVTVDVSALAPGIYGYTAYCTDDNDASRRWRDGEDGLISIVPSGDPSPAPAGGVFVHLFEWPWADIAQECAYLGEMGYTAVQVSPPQEHIQGTPWWTRYQPVSYTINSRSGNLTQFQNMIDTCAAEGVDIYVDAVVNHMAGPGDPDTTFVGSAGTDYRKFQYPYPGASLFGPANFHVPTGACPTASGEIDNYAVRRQVQYCELLGLSDLNYNNPATITAVQAYLNDLIGMGVKGFRMDATKHMFAYDLERLYDGLNNLPDGSRPYIFQEVIGATGEPVKEYEYFYMGDVTEFEATNSLGWHLSGSTGCNGTLSGLSGYGGAGYMPERFAQVFVNNHDNQRGHGTGSNCIVMYKDGVVHDLANVFLLAHPYGHPSVMSSYYFGNNTGDDNQGPPATSIYSGGNPDGCNATDWVCEHRTPAIAHMVQFRAVTAGQGVTDWVNHAADHISFGRGNQGFVAINRTVGNPTTTYQTSGMAAGVYCDVISGQRTADGSACTGGTVTVNGSGQIQSYTLNSMTAFAIHAQSRIGTPQLAASQDFDLAISGSDVVTATLQTHDGLPVANRTVNFAVLSGGGTVNATAVTNANGDATVMYTAPNTVTVGIIGSTYTSDATDGLEDFTAVYVGYRANVSQMHVSRLATGSDTVALGPLQVTKIGTGTPLLTLAIFDGNPQSTRPEGSESSAYVDIHLPDATGITSLDVVLQCNPTPCGDTVWWGNPVTGDWTAVVGATIGINEVSFTIDGSSTPSLSDLTGTPFVVSTNQPLAVSLQSVTTSPNPAATPLLLAGLLLFLLTLAGWATRRRATT